MHPLDKGAIIESGRKLLGAERQKYLSSSTSWVRI